MLETIFEECSQERFVFVLDEEVDQLYNIYKKITKNPKILRIELKEWYDGYRAAAGDYLYNPRSVVCALRDNQLANYWTSSGTYDSIFNYIKGNIADVRNDIPGIILELKINHTPQEAIEQIKEKNYQLKFQGKIGEISAYEGSILAVGISYDRKTKKHSCEVEKL